MRTKLFINNIKEHHSLTVRRYLNGMRGCAYFGLSPFVI